MKNKSVIKLIILIGRLTLPRQTAKKIAPEVAASRNLDSKSCKKNKPEKSVEEEEL